MLERLRLIAGILAFMFSAMSVGQSANGRAFNLKLVKALERIPVNTGNTGIVISQQKSIQSGEMLSPCMDYRLFIGDPEPGLFDLCMKENLSGNSAAAEILWELYGVAKGLNRPEPASCEFVKERLEKAAAYGNTAAQVYVAHFTLNGGHCFAKNADEGKRLLEVLFEKAMSFSEKTSFEDVYAMRLLETDLKSAVLRQHIDSLTKNAFEKRHVRTVLDMISILERGGKLDLHTQLFLGPALITAADHGCTICQVKALALGEAIRGLLTELQIKTYRQNIFLKASEARKMGYGVPVSY